VKEAIRKHPEVKRVNCYIHCSRDILVRDILVDYYVYSDVDMCDEFLGSYESKKLNTYIRRNKLEAVTFDLEIIQDDIEFAAAVLKGVEDYA
jgi:hypothetical protein